METWVPAHTGFWVLFRPLVLSPETFSSNTHQSIDNDQNRQDELRRYLGISLEGQRKTVKILVSVGNLNVLCLDGHSMVAGTS
jgi:hypothetical protein